MTAFTSLTDSPAYCQQPCSSSIATSSFSSPVARAPLGSFFHHTGISENLYFTLHVFGHLLPSLICTLCRPTDVRLLEVGFNYKRVQMEERRGKLSQGESRQEEGTEDTSPDVGPPPDSHWPTERAPDDGGSSPRPHAEPAALQAAGLSEGEGARADERERRVKIIQSRQTLRCLSE